MQTMAASIAALLVIIPITAGAQSWRVPTESERCPSKWGAKDERGSINHQKPEAVLRAIRQVPADSPIDLLLHTPGGLVLASEQIAYASDYSAGT